MMSDTDQFNCRATTTLTLLSYLVKNGESVNFSGCVHYVVFPPSPKSIYTKRFDMPCCKTTLLTLWPANWESVEARPLTTVGFPLLMSCPTSWKRLLQLMDLSSEPLFTMTATANRICSRTYFCRLQGEIREAINGSVNWGREGDKCNRETETVNATEKRTMTEGEDGKIKWKCVCVTAASLPANKLGISLNFQFIWIFQLPL